MRERLRSMISKRTADFADIRYEIRKQTVISFSGKEIKQVNASATDGYVVRAQCGTGFSSAVVTKEEDVPRALTLATEGASTMMRFGGKKVELAPVPVVEDDVEPVMSVDPRQVPITDKIAAARAYNTLMLGQPGIATTNVAYHEVCREKFYVNSEGTAIREVLVTVAIAGEVVAKKGDMLQNIRVAVGGADGWESLVGREDVFLERAGIAARLLDAEPVKGGTYDVVLNPSMAGVFTHEAFGHFSEADIIEDNPSLRSRMALGTQLGSSAVSIVADSTLPGQLGRYSYDDEGVAVRRVQLMKNGVLTGRLHSRATAAAFGETPTGHDVAEDYRYEPIVRMGTIFIEPGAAGVDDLFRRMGDGLYLLDAKGGQTSGENFTFGAQYGFVVENGRVGRMIRDINIMGNLFTTLASIADTASDFRLSERGGCGKGQTNIKSNYGGPHVLISGMVVGGV